MSMSQLVDVVQTARSAAERYAWREAYEAYTSADPERPHACRPRALRGGGLVAGRPDEAISLRERAYGGFSSSGDQLSAAGSPSRSPTITWVEGSSPSPTGWFANAERLLEGQPESAEHGVLMLMRGINALFAEGDLPRAIAEFDRAAEIGLRLGDRDTHALALVGKGRALVKSERSRRVSRSSTRRLPRPCAASCGRSRPGSSTASRSAPVRTSATTAGRRSGPRSRTVGATGSRSRASPARAASIARRSCGSEASGPRRRSRRSPRARSSTTSTATSPRAATTRSARSAAGAATSPPRWRRTRRPTSWGERRSPVSRSCVSPRARSTARSRRSRARSRTPRTRFRGCGACRRRSRSRSRRAT